MRLKIKIKLFSNINKYKYKMNQIEKEILYKKLKKYIYSKRDSIFNFTITIDKKKINLNEAWKLTHDLSELIPGLPKWSKKLVVVERHKKPNLFPHFHGIIESEMLSSQEVLDDIRRLMRNKFGRCEIRKYEYEDEIPEFLRNEKIENEKRDWIEYCLKDVPVTYPGYTSFYNSF